MAGARRSNEVDEAAAQWAMRLDRGSLTDQENAELDAWLAADTRHVGALARAEAIWTDLDRVVALDRTAARARPPARFAWRGWRLAASLVVSLGAAGMGAAFAYERLDGRVATEVGEVRHIALDDGSTMTLDTDSVAQVRYRGGKREVILRRGGAAFQVAAGDPRPFQVAARDLDVAGAEGAFAVGLRQGAVAVDVTQGAVKVARGGRETCTLAKGLRLAAAPEAPLAPVAVDPAETERRLAWRKGVLMFDGERLGVAVAELNRYSKIPVIIEDPALADRAFVGVFRVGDTRSFARAAASAFDARIEQNDREIRLSRG